MNAYKRIPEYLLIIHIDSPKITFTILLLLIKVIYITWFTMARQLETSWNPQRRSTISTACRPLRAFSGSIFGTSPGGGTAPDKIYTSVAAAIIWPQAPALAKDTCKKRDNRVNVWRTVSLMEMGEDDTFMATLETNKQHALSLLDLPNPRSDTTNSLTPTS